MIRTLIIDDEPLPRERIRTLLAEQDKIEVIGEPQDGREAVEMIRREQPDLVFLDIQMPELDGFGVLAALAADRLPAVIFVTAYDEHAIRAFEVNAIDYLLKPINPKRFATAVSRAVERLEASGPKADAAFAAFVAQLRAERSYIRRFVVRAGARLSFVPAREVDWIDTANNYLRLHVSGQQYLVRETMKSVEGQLDPAVFVRVHRSVIINIDRVEAVEPYFHGDYVVMMKDGARITTSRSYSERLRSLLR